MLNIIKMTGIIINNEEGTGFGLKNVLRMKLK
jgi:hypothetical protein